LKNSPTFILGISSFGLWIDGKFCFTNRSLQFLEITDKSLGNPSSLPSVFFLSLFFLILYWRRFFLLSFSSLSRLPSPPPARAATAVGTQRRRRVGGPTRGAAREEWRLGWALGMRETRAAGAADARRGLGRLTRRAVARPRRWRGARHGRAEARPGARVSAGVRPEARRRLSRRARRAAQLARDAGVGGASARGS
jgi:hypothetical protein